ncbi:MAG: serine protease [Myxococcales bacterium]|jgi:S1-C subfamily serine protease|nr:serine protease [Myxococcales bacterium]
MPKRSLFRALAFLPLAAVLSTGAARAAESAEAADPIQAIERFQQALFDRIAPSVVLISAKGKFGSGFFVNADGLVLTNAHVVGDSASVEVVLHDGKRLAGAVVERGQKDVDLALVQVAAKSPTPLALQMQGLRVGSWVAAVGHGLGGIWTFSTGMVTNIYPIGAERPVFQTQIPLNPGASGGPIVDRLGRVVGITTAGIPSANNVNFGIRIDVAPQVLSQLADECCLVVLVPADVPLFVDGKMVGKGPRVVLPAEARAYEVSAVIGGQLRREEVSFPAQRRLDWSK